MSRAVDAEPAGRAEIRRRPSNRRQQILESAAVLFAERGFDRVTMAQIADDVDITAGALYRHFKRKSELLAAVLVDGFERSAPAGEESRSLSDFLQVRATVAAEVPNLDVLWSRDAQHLPELEHESLLGRVRAINASYRAVIRPERPDISGRDLSLLAWAMESVLSSTSIHVKGLNPGDYAAILRDACLAIARTDLPELALPEVGPRVGLIPQSRREALLAIAGRLFSERGYDGTSLADIGAEANVSGPSLYTYFENKAEILQVILDRGDQALWLDLTEALQTSVSPAVALERTVESYIRLVETRPYLITVLVNQSGALNEAALRSQREYVQEWVRLLTLSRPKLTSAQAHALVRAGIRVINNVGRIPSSVGSSDFSDRVKRVVLAVLFAESSK